MAAFENALEMAPSPQSPGTSQKPTGLADYCKVSQCFSIPMDTLSSYPARLRCVQSVSRSALCAVTATKRQDRPTLTAMRSLIVASLAFLTSCGVMFRPGPWQVPMATHPPGATVTYMGKEVGVTPCAVSVGRKGTLVEVQLDGYHKQIVDVGARFNGCVFFNILGLGVLGIIIDAAGGGFWVVNSRRVVVELVPLSEGEPMQPWTRSMAKAGR